MRDRRVGGSRRERDGGSGATPGRVDRVVVSSGNKMIDQFQPWYFGCAFAFVFKYGTGMPDMHEFAEARRYVRAPDASG